MRIPVRTSHGWLLPHHGMCTGGLRNVFEGERKAPSLCPIDTPGWHASACLTRMRKFLMHCRDDGYRGQGLWLVRCLALKRSSNSAETGEGVCRREFEPKQG